MMQWKVGLLTAAIVFAISGVGFAQKAEEDEEEKRTIAEVMNIINRYQRGLARLVDKDDEVGEMEVKMQSRGRMYTQEEYDAVAQELADTQTALANDQQGGYSGGVIIRFPKFGQGHMINVSGIVAAACQEMASYNVDCQDSKVIVDMTLETPFTSHGPGACGMLDVKVDQSLKPFGGGAAAFQVGAMFNIDGPSEQRSFVTADGTTVAIWVDNRRHGSRLNLQEGA